MQTALAIAAAYLLGSISFQKDNFDMANPHYLWVQKCMNVREKYPVLQSGDSVYERWNQGGSGQNESRDERANGHRAGEAVASGPELGQEAGEA